MMTVLESLKLAKEYLEKYQIENPRLNAELLLSEVLNCKRLDLYTNFEKPLKEEEIQKFREYLLRRTKGEPVQYITGKAYFYGFEFIVTPDVLIPRPETELLVEEVIDAFEKNESLRIADLCSGSGNIGITLAKFFPNSEVDCIDVSEKAIEIGRLNAEKLNAVNVSFYKIDILNDELPQKIYDVIVSNPPYVDAIEMDALPEEFLQEPRLGLEAGEDGLDLVRKILAQAAAHLKDDGVLIVEVGVSQYYLEEAYPELPFYWFEFAHGGEGVFAIQKSELVVFQELLDARAV
jgi:ribosomal protein L3 glutamine methyltransferase